MNHSPRIRGRVQALNTDFPHVTGIHGNVARIDMTYSPGPYTPQARTIAGHIRDVAAPILGSVISAKYLARITLTGSH
jgi:hypothetical protein